MPIVLRYLELIFTAAGVVVILGVTWLIHPSGVSPWTVAAITATLVGIIHGILFWVVRQRQRLARLEALNETQRMLRDVVINQLAVIRINAEMQSLSARTDTKAALARLETAMQKIDLTLNDISEESIARWRTRYNFPPSPYSN
jgi:uncharacterized membrane protein YcjF (UPF0283 family)